MIAGQVSSDRQALVTVQVKALNSAVVEIEAAVDTGFTEYLTLPASVISDLGLRHVLDADMELADGSVITMRTYRAVLAWDGVDRQILVHEAAGIPLLGMSALYGYLLSIQAVDGGTVTIAAL